MKYRNKPCTAGGEKYRSQREAARHHSLTADLAIGMVSGLGARGYLLALEALAGILRDG